jgi:hypothetical protein
MALIFEPIAIEKQNEYLGYLEKCPLKTSDYSFVNLWSWSEKYGLFWAWERDLVWIKQTIPKVLYWAPVGSWQSVNWALRLKQHLSGSNTFARIPDALVQDWKKGLEDRLMIDEDRGQWDYLYNRSDLVNLNGNRFHKKKNLLNQFKKKYDYNYREIGPDIIDLALAMQSDWCTWRDCESSQNLSAENQAIEKVFQYWGLLSGLTGGALMVNQKVVAYTVAESLSEDILLIHFEKANPDYKGGYQAINQIFLAHSDEKFKTVNREQDLDDEGLRKAKLSYHPIDFIKKYRVIVL